MSGIHRVVHAAQHAAQAEGSRADVAFQRLEPRLQVDRVQVEQGKRARPHVDDLPLLQPVAQAEHLERTALVQGAQVQPHGLGLVPVVVAVLDVRRRGGGHAAVEEPGLSEGK